MLVFPPIKGSWFSLQKFLGFDFNEKILLQRWNQTRNSCYCFFLIHVYLKSWAKSIEKILKTSFNNGLSFLKYVIHYPNITWTPSHKIDSLKLYHMKVV